MRKLLSEAGILMILFYRQEEPKVFNCVSGYEKPVRWGEINQFGMKAMKTNALNDVVWYPSLHFTPHRTVNSVASIFKHWIPACIIDILAKFSGKRPM